MAAIEKENFRPDDLECAASLNNRGALLFGQVRAQLCFLSGACSNGSVTFVCCRRTREQNDHPQNRFLAPRLVVSRNSWPCWQQMVMVRAYHCRVDQPRSR